MKLKTTTVLILITSSIMCIAQPYTSINIDANNLLNIKENNRTQTNGLDFDIELGVIDENIGAYIFYGAFINANYQNYGFGVDAYLISLDRFKMSLGNQYHVVIRTKEQKHLGTTDSYFNPRGKVSYDLSFLTIDLIAKLTKRNDIDKRIFEGSIGVTKKFE